MKCPQLILITLLLLGCIAGIVNAQGVRENFQSWGSSTISASSGYIYLSNSSTGEVSFYVGGTDYNYLINSDPTIFEYAAFDCPLGSTADILLYDGGGNQISNTLHAWYLGVDNRVEMKIIGGTPTLFQNGIQYSTGSNIEVNPSYIKISGTYNYNPAVLDNILIGETDHHVVGALPTNGSIINDFINPSATGYSLWDNSSQTWVTQNSHYFYIDADTDSQDATYTEYFDLVNLNTGITVNTTTIDSTIPRHQIQYNITKFISEAQAALGDQSIDGEYYAQFRGYPDSRDYFWMISSGASIYWDHEKYSIGSTATVTYAVSSSYWNTATYTYKVDILDIYGTVKKTQEVTSQTGTLSVSIDSTTYPAGTYYAEIIATKISDSSTYIMNAAAMETTDYVYITGGYVMNAETGAILSGANTTITQGTTNVSYISTSSGWGNATQYWLTGTSVEMITRLTGYTNDYREFTPLAAGTITTNISLQPSTLTCSGVCIGGVVNSSQYGDLIPGATYHVRNGTDNTCTTNIAGFCKVDGLVNGTIYDVWSSKTGFGNSTVHQVMAVGV